MAGTSLLQFTFQNVTTFLSVRDIHPSGKAAGKKKKGRVWEECPGVSWYVYLGGQIQVAKEEPGGHMMLLHKVLLHVGFASCLQADRVAPLMEVVLLLQLRVSPLRFLDIC